MSSVILPVIALLALVIGGVFHIDIDEGTQKALAEGIALLVASGTALYGIFKNHFKKKEDEKTP